MTELQSLLHQAASWRRQGRKLALGTITATRGSTYRGVGAMILLDGNETYYGLISGGCLEGDLSEKAAPVARGERAPLHVDYDLSQEELWSLGIGCNGSVRVYVEPLTAELEAFLSRAAGRQTLARTVDIQTGRWEEVPVGATSSELKGQLFLQVIRPAPAAYVFGAGHDAIPLVARLADAGFYVTVVDPREAFVTEERFPQADALQVLRPEQADQLSVECGGFAVLMHHQKERDQLWLSHLAKMPLRYIGMLGPFGRTLDMLGALDLDPKDERFYYPMGLDIGAERPEAVAISIAGEMLAVHHGRKGGLLRWNDRPIHS